MSNNHNLDLNDLMLHAMYFADGFNSCMEDNQMPPDMKVGHIECMSEMALYAQAAEDMANAGYEITGDYPGVFDYEVSTGFGKWFARYILANGEFPSTKSALDALAKETHNFFNSPAWESTSSRQAWESKFRDSFKRAIDGVIAKHIGEFGRKPANPTGDFRLDLTQNRISNILLEYAQEERKLPLEESSIRIMTLVHGMGIDKDFVENEMRVLQGLYGQVSFSDFQGIVKESAAKIIGSCSDPDGSPICRDDFRQASSGEHDIATNTTKPKGMKF